jgi:signal transduction histidine kinase
LILLAFEDITDRRQAERALKESEARLRDLAQQLLTLQEEERQELSCELQESLAQNIAALKMQLRFFERGLPQGDHKPREDLHQIMVTMDEIMDNLRRRAADLSPQMLMDLGLATGLKSLCEDYRLACTLDLEDLSKIFTMDEQVGIYRVFQEALNNISRHAQASQVTIAAKKTDDRVDFLIEDNGQGFDLDRLEGSGAELRGIGLSAMSERVRALGGTFKIESQPGVGTRIFFSLPRNRKQ